MPNRLLTLILLACDERASSVFALGGGDPLRSAFATAIPRRVCSRLDWAAASTEPSFYHQRDWDSVVQAVRQDIK
jgi:hypothetical protein